MHFFSRRKASLVLSLTAVGVLAACGDDVTVPVEPPPPVVISITPQNVTLNPQGTATLAVQITGGNPTPTLASCTSANSAVATAAVSGNSCTVTAVASGSTTITAATSAGQAASANVQVAQLPSALGDLTVSPATAGLSVGQTVTLVPNANPSQGVTPTFTYVSSSNSIATVSASGVVTAVAPGTATVTVTANGSGAGYAAASRTFGVTITVSAAPPAISALNVQPAQLAIATGGTGQLTASATQPAGATAATIAFSSSNTAVATVSGTGSNATVVGVAPGTATITVTATAPASATLSATTLTQLVPVTVAPQAVVSIQNITQGPITTSYSNSSGAEGIVAANNPNVGQPVDITNTRDQIQVAVNLITNGQRIDSLVVYIQPAAGGARRAAARQLFTNGQASSGLLTFFVNTADFTADFDAGTADILFPNGQQVVSASVFTTNAGGTAQEIQVAANNRQTLNFNNVDGWAVRFTVPQRVAQGGTTAVPSGSSLGNLNWYGGPGAMGEARWTIVPVFYTPGRSVQTVTTSMAQLNAAGTPGFATANVCSSAASVTYTNASTLPFRTAIQAATAAPALSCGGYEHAQVSDPRNLPIITAAIDNQNNAAPIVRTLNGYRSSASVSQPVPVRLDYNAPAITWVQNPQTTGQQQFWVNAAYNFARTTSGSTQAINFADGGVGLPATLGTTYAYAGCPLSSPISATPRTTMSTATGADIPECATDLTGGATPGPYVADATQADVLGNTRTTTSSRFGVDKTAPNIRFAASDYQGAANADSIVKNVLPAATDTLFLAQYLDSRSGFIANTTGAFQHTLTRAAQDALTGSCVVGSGSPGSTFVSNPACGFSTTLTTAPDAQPTLGDGYRQARPILGSDVASAIPAYLTYKAQVVDRAGNASATLNKKYVINNQNPQVTGLGVPGTVTATNWSFVPNYTDLVEAWFGNLRLVFPQVNTFVENSATSPDTLVFPAQALAARFDDAILVQGNSTLTGPASFGSTFYTGIETTSLADLVIGSPAAPKPTNAGVELYGVTGLQGFNTLTASVTPLYVPLLSGNVANSTNWSSANPLIQRFKMDSLRAGFLAPQGVKAIVFANTNQINSPFVRVDFWRKASASNGVQETWQLVGSVDGASGIPSDGGTFRTWSYVLTTSNLINTPSSLSTNQTMPVAGQRIMACGVKADGRALCSDPFMNTFGGTLQ